MFAPGSWMKRSKLSSGITDVPLGFDLPRLALPSTAAPLAAALDLDSLRTQLMHAMQKGARSPLVQRASSSSGRRAPPSSQQGHRC